MPRDEVTSLRDAALRAVSKLRGMSREFMSDRFTDRYGDGPEMAEIAEALEAALSTPHAEGMKTPSSRWAANGKPDPHGDRYACERSALAMGDMSDDELANAVFMYGDTKPSMADLMSGKAMLPSAYLMAAKDRIRWLSRKLASPAPAQQAVGDWMPIETAPSGSRVVLFCDARGNRWTQTADCRVPVCGHPPILWTELPHPPAASNAAEQESQS